MAAAVGSGSGCLARHAIELGNATECDGSVQRRPGDRRAEDDTWHGTWPLGDSSLSRLMEANDPQDTIARCEAELAILDLYEQQAAGAGETPWQGPGVDLWPVVAHVSRLPALARLPARWVPTR